MTRMRTNRSRDLAFYINSIKKLGDAKWRFGWRGLLLDNLTNSSNLKAGNFRLLLRPFLTFSSNKGSRIKYKNGEPPRLRGVKKLIYFQLTFQ